MRPHELFRARKRVLLSVSLLSICAALLVQAAQADPNSQADPFHRRRQPTITSFTPTSGPPKTKVPITGTNFYSTNKVAFNGTNATYTVNSGTQITATVPTDATAGPISITTSAGSATSTSTFSVTSAAKPPTITGFSPSSGAPGTSVTISGTSFTGASAVAFNGTNATYTVNSDTQITATVPTDATTGPISVTTSAGSATSTSTFSVTSAAKPPTITGFSPSSGAPGTSVTISGTSFTGASAVAFNGTNATYTVNSDTQITATVPTDATTGPISVTTSAGTSKSSTPFTASSSGPITITSGGTYSGNWSSATSKPAIQINTTQAVTITNSDVQNLAGGDLIDAESDANVTITHTTFEGGNGRAFYAYRIKSVAISNCTITSTSGIRLDGAQNSATVLVTKNKVRNIQDSSFNTVFFQSANVDTATIDVSWNEVINTFGQSGVEDNISIYATAYANVHDNYIQGAYPSSAKGSFSGSGIMIDYKGSHDNNVYSNQVVDTTNAGIGLAGGWNNKVYNNRIISDGKLDDGTPLAAANVGLYVWNMYGDPGWANNDAYGNTVGWVNGKGNRNDWWNPNCSGSCSNTHFSDTLNHAAEQSEHETWLAKLAASNISVGD